MTPDADCDAGYCGLVEVDLSRPELAAFRGRFRLEAVGKDRFGNTGSGSGELEVTRWKWELDTGRTIITPPAIGSRGIVYVANRASLDGGVVAIRPGGTIWWSAATEPPSGQLAVAEESDARVEMLYTTVGSSVQKMALLYANGGKALSGCPIPDGGTANYQAGGLVLGSGSSLDGGQSEIILAGFHDSTANGFQLMGLRWNSPSSGECFWNAEATASFAGMVADGAHFYFATHRGSHFTMAAGVSSNTVIDRFECFGASRLAITGSTLVGVNQTQGIVYSSNSPKSVCTAFADTNPEGFQTLASAPVLDAQGRILYGSITGDGGTSLGWRSPDGAEQLERTRTRGAVRGAPVLGQGGLVYTATATGALQVWNSHLDSEWVLPELELAPVTLPTTLDCSRDGRGDAQPGRPGIWYVPHGSRLRAILVDSRGLDTDAKWPKHQHDPRNTGNAAVDLKQFACP
ncbi:hypothetical protein [Vitiosangium sp. GDMCC 1.1324]|uniref:hypothetical protein n=1 Tax=Vitiosangium sp. (strain GDMCC 1.1324) TaxID=2138576 RepID=UPI000D3CEB15|nr:hypothetical protein [Vitiosangium sp. GDMCC 1.1324]PTL75505.1 hypothetical protein DAT35_54595 [Vitiosangium sp. GDMCC 1.1324]